MKRAIERWIFLLAVVILAATTSVAQQPAPAPPPSSTSDKPRDQKNGTGVVPPGVKLDPNMPAPAAPRPFEFPEPATKTLSNGLRVFVVTDHREPAVAARLVIMTAGSVQDPGSAPGLAQMTANLLTQGTATRSAKEIADAIDFVGGMLNAQAGKDSTTVTLQVVRKDLSTGLDLMSDIVLHPAFSAEELDRQRQQLLSTLTVQYSDPEYLASLVFSRVVYGDSPYGWPGEGTPEVAKKLQRDQLAKFHDGNYAPNQTLLAFAGDVTPEEAFTAAEKYFGSWQKSTLMPGPPAAPPTISGLHIWLVDKPDAQQTQIRVGKLGVRRADPDYIPAAVTNRVFGGGYNSRLNTEVRIKKGLTYGAYSSFNPHRYAGSFSAGTFTRTEMTAEATKLVVELITKMSTGDVTEKELDFARDYLAGVYPIQSETAEQVAERVLSAAAFGLPADYNRTYPDKVRSVTLSQVEAMGQRYFAAKDLDIVLAGNVSMFRDALKKEFPIATYEEIPYDQLDVLAADLRRPKEKSAAATPESFEEGKRVLLAAAKAAGGEELTSVKSLEFTESGNLFASNGENHVAVKWLVSYPNRSHGDVSLPNDHVVQICDGKSAWLQFSDHTVEVSQVVNEFERGLSLFGGGWGVYREVLSGELAGHAIGEEEIDGKKTQGVAVQAPFGGVKLYFDPDTHLLVAARYQSVGQHGPMDNEQRWSDYRPVDGRQFAYSTVIFRDGAKFVESAVQDVQLNPKVDDSLFAKPDVATGK